MRPAEAPQLEAGVVHVWRAVLDAQPSGEADILSPAERDRAARFRFERDRARFTASHVLLRGLLSSYTGLDPAAVAFAYSPHGKPYLEQDESLRFNLSHSHGVAMLAFARREVGIDVERVRADIDMAGLAQTCFSPAERHDVFSRPPEKRLEAFFECWTAKEACIKAEGLGLSIPLHRFRIAERGDVAETVAEPGVAMRTWTVRRLSAGDGYRAAVAASGSGWSVLELEAA